VDESWDAPPVVLSLNAGSASFKAAVRDPDVRIHVELSGLDAAAARLTVSGTGSFDEHAIVSGGWGHAVPIVAEAVTRHGLHPAVVVHRIVDGSEVLLGPQRVTDDLLARLRAEAHVDPLQLPRQLALVDEARAAWPEAQVVLCPDSVFHRGLPDEAVAFPLPPDARGPGGLRRRGFHGLAVQSVVDQLPDLGSAVVVHLGRSCSVTAVEHGRSRWTSMAVSPAGGIPSLTRTGDLDPEAVLRLVEAHGGSVAAVRALVNERSGVSGISGGRTDVRELLAAHDPAADLALRVFARSVAMAVAGAVTTLDGWDTLVFTGGIGVHSAEMRERICARLLVLRPAARSGGVPSQRLAESGLRIAAVPADEEAVLDRMARAVALPEPVPLVPGRG
jgi:acetate kinase